MVESSSPGSGFAAARQVILPRGRRRARGRARGRRSGRRRAGVEDEPELAVECSAASCCAAATTISASSAGSPAASSATFAYCAVFGTTSRCTGALRRDVAERDEPVVLEDDVGGDLARDDALGRSKARSCDTQVVPGRRSPAAERALSTASAAGPAVEVRSTSAPSRTGSLRPLERLELFGRDAALGPDDERAGRGRRARESVSRVGCGGLEHEDPRLRRERASCSRRRESSTSGTHGRMACLLASRTIAAQRSRPLSTFAPSQRDDAALGRPRDDAVDAELGRRLHRELVAVALGERLREEDRRARSARPARLERTSNVSSRGSASTTVARRRRVPRRCRSRRVSPDADAG